MYKKLAQVPASHSQNGQVSARQFNQACIALKRLGSPLRFPVAGLRSLQMILDEESWVCVDTGLNDMPIAAWTEFQARGRDNLHLPIPCRVSHYHANAAVIAESLLREMENHLAGALLPAG